MTKKIKKLASSVFIWLDEYLLLLFTGFLIAFIPLYPKIPLAELIPGYIVRMRLEDIFVLLASIVWCVQILRKKIKYKSITLWLICFYLFFSALSLLSAATITHTIPWQALHLGKSFLHWLRYFEYFVLFAITFSSIKKPSDIRVLFKIIFISLIGIVVYGYGQRYHYWPVFSTMNREFSKGIRLYLTEHARVQSTFGGHYDLAAYLVIVLNLVLAMALTVKQKFTKLTLHVLHLLGLWLLILSASRVSFVAYFFGATTTILVLSQTYKTKLRKFSWGTSRIIMFSFLVGAMMLAFGQDMRDRLFQVVKEYPQVEITYSKIDTLAQETSTSILVFIGLKQSNKQPNADWVAVDLSDQSTVEQSVLDKTDQRPVSSKPRPDDVYVDIPDKVRIATESATGEIEYLIVERDRTWSINALKYGLSAAIRLDTLWPNAIKGLIKNPLLGSGFATLNKETFYHFTEAESTDNNFLRTLGETGIIGFISFFGIILINCVLALKLFIKIIKKKKQKTHLIIIAFLAGFIGASLGLLINAVYIDVFASSKVAFTYWIVAGIIVALCYQEPYYQLLKNTWPMKLERVICSQFSKLKRKK